MTDRYRKLKNLLRKNGIETPKNKLALDFLWAAFPEHGKLAEWLHREIRAERMKLSCFEILANLEYFMQHAKQCDLYAQDTRRFSLEERQHYKRSAKNNHEAAKRESKTLEDPELLRNTFLKHRPTGTLITSEFLDIIEALLYKRKQRGDEANIMRIDTDEICQEVKDELLKHKALGAGQVLYTFEDGWTIRRIRNAKEAELEAEMLGHCITQYGSRIEAGESHNYSLRDEKGIAHLTLEIKHQRPTCIDWDLLIAECADSDFACPACAMPVIDKHCVQCAFNLEDLREWDQADAAVKREIEDRVNAKIAQITEQKNAPYLGAICPTCKSKRLEDRCEDPAHKWFCKTCNAIFWKTGDPWAPNDPDLTKGNLNRARRNRDLITGPAAAETFSGRLWLDRLRTALAGTDCIQHDLRDGNAFQIQGKQNVAPQEKYHPYLLEWLRSIPYKERPKAKWSAYFTATPVLHIDDLERGGPKGEDDFGFKFPNRAYDWESILNSLHGKPKRWQSANQNHRYADEKVPTREDVKYVPKLGTRLFEFVHAKGSLDALIEAFQAWKMQAIPGNLQDPGHFPEERQNTRFEKDAWLQLKCHRCGDKGMITTMHCGGAGAVCCLGCERHEQPRRRYQEQWEKVRREILEGANKHEPQYSLYQKETIFHLGSLIEEAHPTFKITSLINKNAREKVNNETFKLASEFGWGDSTIKIRSLGDYFATPATIIGGRRAGRREQIGGKMTEGGEYPRMTVDNPFAIPANEVRERALDEYRVTLPRPGVRVTFDGE